MLCVFFLYTGLAATYENYVDDYCLCLLLKGVCLKHRDQFFQAEQCFQEIIEKYVTFINNIYKLSLFVS